MRTIIAVHRPLIILIIAAVLSYHISSLFLAGVFIMILDTIARYRDFRRYQGIHYTLKRVLLFEQSWCSRGVAIALWGRYAIEDYQLFGYRWYHIFPNEFPLVFFRISFWKSVVGINPRGIGWK